MGAELKNIDNKITVDPKGNFGYQYGLLAVPAGYQVRWYCEDPFSITFPEGTPFAQMDFPALHDSGVWEAFSGGIVPGTPQRIYHYHVAAFNQKSKRVLADSGCPGVKPSPGGGG